MAFKINGIDIKWPTTYKPLYANTSTEDSGRTQDGVMHNSVMFANEGIPIGWELLTPAEASTILQQVVGKSYFDFTGLDPYSGQWETHQCTAANFDIDLLTLVEGKELWKSLSFQLSRVNPI